MAEFTTKGVGTAGLTTGIIGTVLGAANSGLLGNFIGGAAPAAGMASVANTAMCVGDHYVTQKEMQYIQQLNEERYKNAILTSEQSTEIKIADVYERIMTKVNQNQRDQADWNASQSVINAQVTAAITTNSNSIAGLNATVGSITKTAVPKAAICDFGCGCGGCGGANI